MWARSLFVFVECIILLTYFVKKTFVYFAQFDNIMKLHNINKTIDKMHLWKCATWNNNCWYLTMSQHPKWTILNFERSNKVHNPMNSFDEFYLLLLLSRFDSDMHFIANPTNLIWTESFCWFTWVWQLYETWVQN